MSDTKKTLSPTVKRRSEAVDMIARALELDVSMFNYDALATCQYVFVSSDRDDSETPRNIEACKMLADIEHKAVQGIEDAYPSWPIAYFDLDDIQGERGFVEDDVVEYDGERHTVLHDTQVLGDSGYFTGYVLEDEDGEEVDDVDPSEMTLIEPADWYDDERLPARYDVAKFGTFVAFNTVPNPA